MLQAGQVFHNRYQLQTPLGENSGRQTWLATDLAAHASTLVVVKFLAVSPLLQWEDLKLFEREATVLKQLDHPQIPKYLDYFAIEKQAPADLPWFGLVQTYIPGLSLKQLLMQSNRFSQAQSRKIAIEILRVLIYLHELSPPVLHRDIKPSNVIWGQDQRIYLIDFGAVQDRAKAEGATFTVVGTFGYTPLEQFRGQAVAASDLYALGATLIHLLTGVAPTELPQRGLAMQFGDRVKLLPSFAHWLEAMTAPSLEHRFKTARQALEALEREVDDAPLLPAQRPPSSQVRIHVSPERLSIEIPQPHLSSKSVVIRLVLFTLIFKLLRVITNFLTGPLLWVTEGVPWQIQLALGALWVLLLIGAIDTGFGFLTFFRTCRVQFDRDRFAIWQQWLGWRYRQQQGRVKAIRDVGQTVHLGAFNSFQLKELQSEKDMITLQTHLEKHSFGVGLSAMECAWLVQEIEAWLLLQKTKFLQTPRHLIQPASDKP